MIDYTKLARKLAPDPNREAQGLALRTAVVDSVNPDGTADVVLSGAVIENVPVLASAPVMAGLVVQMLTIRGGFLVLGPVSGKRTLIKSADQLLTLNSTTLQDITGLSFTGLAGAICRVELWMSYDAHTSQDIKAAWSVPSGATMARNILAPAAGTTSNESTSMVAIRRGAATGQVAGGPSTVANAFSVWHETTLLRMGSVDGTVQLQAAQANAGSASPQSVVKGDSMFVVERIG